MDESKPNGGAVLTEEGEMLAFRAATSALAERIVFARMMGMTHEGKRNVYGVLGYDDSITSRQYRDRYARGGIARKVVNSLPKAVWRGDGVLYENEKAAAKKTAFEAEWLALNEQHAAWSTFMRAHILASLGSFSGILLGARGDLESELPRGTPGGLLYLRPIGGGVVTGTDQQRGASSTTDANIIVKEWDENVRSRRFGLPLSYQLKDPNFSNAMYAQAVHWTRIIHVPACDFLDNDVFGPPSLECVWNYLLDLDKVAGGGSEAFWLRANAGMQIDVDKKMALADAKGTLEALQEQVERYEHQLSRVMRTRGVNINQLGSDVADFKGPADALVTLIAGTCGIPKRILVGTERGELASGQDADNWDDQVKDCRAAYAKPTILRQFVERTTTYGYLTTPKQWDVAWPDVAEMSETERIDAAGKAAALNDHGQVVILSEEIREMYLGLQPLTSEQIAAATPEPAVPEPAPDNVDDEELDDEKVDKIAAALGKGATVTIEVKR